MKNDFFPLAPEFEEALMERIYAEAATEEKIEVLKRIQYEAQDHTFEDHVAIYKALDDAIYAITTNMTSKYRASDLAAMGIVIPTEQKGKVL